MAGPGSPIRDLLLAEFGDDGSIAWGGAARVSLQSKTSKGRCEVQLTDQQSGSQLLTGTVHTGSLWNVAERVYLLKVARSSEVGESHARPSALRCCTQDAQSAMELLLQTLPSWEEAANEFERKTNAGSADLYFHYYGMLQHQQNMLQDYVRTGSYYAAILENARDFHGKTVMDVGAGSGILSLFAAQAVRDQTLKLRQAGAKKVYAVEASAMADYARILMKANPGLGARIEIVQGKVEELGPEVRCDVLVSEPMGTLLLNERMLETYLFARDHFLRPGGRMFPQVGRIHCAAFSDEVLHAEVVAKAAFWQQENYYGVNLTSLLQPAINGYLSQVVVDAVHPSHLVSGCATKVFDFGSVREEELHEVVIPLNLTAGCACNVHGIACWFDVLFDGSTTRRWLSTAPGLPTTHWFQLRCLVSPALSVAAGAEMRGEMRLSAHARQSYDIHLTLSAPPIAPGLPAQHATAQLDLKDPYYRQLNPAAWWQQAHMPAEQGPQHAAAEPGLQPVAQHTYPAEPCAQIPGLTQPHPQQAALDAVYGQLLLHQPLIALQHVQQHAQQAQQAQDPQQAQQVQQAQQAQQAQQQRTHASHAVHAGHMANGYRPHEAHAAHQQSVPTWNHQSQQ